MIEIIRPHHSVKPRCSFKPPERTHVTDRETSETGDALTLEDLERIITEDGSVTYRLRERDITYRSRFGALEESRRVFLDPSGIREQGARDTPWKVVELGFGVGTNFRNTATFATGAKLPLLYLAAELAPIPPDAIEGESDIDEMTREALAMARAQGHARVTRGDITLVIRVSEWLDITPEDEPDFQGCDAVYYDPFGPRDDLESWSREHLAHGARWLGATGRLMTYSVAGKVRRGLRAAGLWVATLPGHIKREVLVACLDKDTVEALEPLRKWPPDEDQDDSES
jgi:tRNA U34 5-methylaminomethyl-2-thiouridine-forming methyltransferase MnmC